MGVHSPSAHTQPGSAKTVDPVLRGLYSPSLRQVGCDLLAAAFGIGDRRVNNIFDSRDWFVAPVDDMFLMDAPLSQWRFVADLPRDERPGPDHFADMRAAKAATAENSVGAPEGANPK